MYINKDHCIIMVEAPFYPFLHLNVYVKKEFKCIIYFVQKRDIL